MPREGWPPVQGHLAHLGVEPTSILRPSSVARRGIQGNCQVNPVWGGALARRKNVMDGAQGHLVDVCSVPNCES